MRRILFVQHTASPSGSAVSLGALIGALDPSRYECVMACTSPTDKLRSYYRELNIPVVPAPGLGHFPHTTGGWYRLWKPSDVFHLLSIAIRFRASIRNAERLYRQQQPDLVHLNSVVLIAAAIAARRMGIPLVWQVREHVVNGHLGLRKRVIAHYMRTLPDASVFLSASDMAQLGASSTWRVIPNFVDIQKIDSTCSKVASRTRLGIPTDAKVILFLGGYSLIKGPTVLLGALPYVVTQIPNVHCLFVGAHERSDALIPRLARQLLPLLGRATPSQQVEQALAASTAQVTLLGWRDDIDMLFAASDVLAVPSTEPHFSRPAMEAACRRVPVVGSRTPGITDLVEHGATGLLVDPCDPAALAAALVEVLGDKQYAASLAEAAFRRAREYFDQDSRVREIADIYDSIFARQSDKCASQ